MRQQRRRLLVGERGLQRELNMIHENGSSGWPTIMSTRSRRDLLLTDRRHSACMAESESS